MDSYAWLRPYTVIFVLIGVAVFIYGRIKIRTTISEARANEQKQADIAQVYEKLLRDYNMKACRTFGCEIPLFGIEHNELCYLMANRSEIAIRPVKNSNIFIKLPYSKIIWFDALYSNQLRNINIEIIGKSELLFLVIAYIDDENVEKYIVFNANLPVECDAREMNTYDTSQINLLNYVAQFVPRAPKSVTDLPDEGTTSNGETIITL